MARERARKCSHCGHNGHNSRTCNGTGCFKLFGVELLDQSQDQSLKRSTSLGNLDSLTELNSHVDDGYLSDGQVHFKKAKAAHERKKGKPWTDDEHRNFLSGLKLLGKGDWKGISKKFVPTRTPTQVASHAQKFFLRQGLSDKKHRRSSVFDIQFNEFAGAPPEDSPSSLSDKPATETSSQASASSSIMPLESTLKISSQVNHRFPHLCLDRFPIAATSSIPNYCGFPYMVGAPSNGQIFSGTRNLPSLSFAQTMNYQKSGYIYMPGNFVKSTACTPVTPHPSGIPPPQQSFERSTFQDAPRTSNAKDSLELKIDPPESPRGANLSSQASGAIQVV